MIGVWRHGGGELVRAPRSYRWASSSHQHPSGTLDPPLEAVSPLPPLIQCPAQGFLSSPRNSNGTGLAGGHLPQQQQQRLCTLCFQGP